jgi:cytochrome c oxidase subunit 4
MSETNLTHDQEMEVESHTSYGTVWVYLAVLTAIEYGYARWFKDSFAGLVAGLMLLAVVKASLVGWFFMHLKFEGRWVYYMLVPAGILAAVLVFALVPDIALQPESDQSVSEEEATASVPIPSPLVPVAFRS